MSNDTLDKIDEAIKRIQDEDYGNSKDEVVEEVKDDTDTKIFDSSSVSSDLEVTKEFNGTFDEINTSELDVNVNVNKKSNVGIYISYFICLFVVISLVLLFILFLYK